MPKTITVLQSFPQPRETTNPYIVMLKQSLEQTDGVEVLTFSWRNALFGHYDVFHAHWPEILLKGSSPAKTWARRVATAAFFARLAVTRTPVVRTLHNLDRPQGISVVDNLVLAAFERMTDLVVLINPTGEAPRGKRSIRILHGHYRDWFARFPMAAARPGQLGYTGLIKQYKGVENLIEAFKELDDDTARLWIGGKPSSPEHAREIEQSVAGDGRIRADLRYISEEELVQVVTSSQVEVLPYRHMHNSGSALAALSMDRPVLVPDNEANRALADEMGPGWVLFFDGDLDTDDLRRAIAETADASQRSERPEMSRREWDRCGIDLRDAYASLL